MSDLIFMGGALTLISLCIAAMIGFALYEVIEFTKDKKAPVWAKWGLVIFTIAFLAMLFGVALKIMENL